MLGPGVRDIMGAVPPLLLLTAWLIACDGGADHPGETGDTDAPDVYEGWPDRVVSLANADHVLVGEAPTDVAGAHLAWLGDVDGDGASDLLVSAYWNDEAGENAGKVYVVRASSLAGDREHALAEADFALLGEAGIQSDDTCGDGPTGSTDNPEVCGGDWAGHSVAGAGDVDGDGLSDFLVSGYGSDDDGEDRGRLYLVRAADLVPGTASLSQAAYIFSGEADGDRMGHSVHIAGDVDGDGIPEVISGAYGSDAGGFNAGKGYLWLGSSLGDAPNRLLASEADFGFVGEEPLDQAGYIVSPMGDVDGDGLGDFAIAALDSEEGGTGRGPSGERGSGKVYLQLAADLPAGGGIQSCADIQRAWVGEAGGDAVGYGTNAAGDVDGDGLDDLLFGAYGNDEGGTDAGKAYVVLAASIGGEGARSLSTADHQLVGTGHELAGQSTASVGDLDDDGRSDLLISARNDLFLFEKAGGAYLLLSGTLRGAGTLALVEADHHFQGEEGLDQAGYTVAGVGDVDGDGRGDLLIGAWQSDRLDQPGRAYLLLTP